MMTDKKKSILYALGIIVLSLCCYSQVISEAGFIWDDDDYVTQNKLLWEEDGLSDIWFSPKKLPQYYPLVHTSYWIEYQIVELEPFLYHFDNVLLHALNAILLAFILRQLKIPGAWLAACLFAIHPVHVETVAWITERKNTLSATFYLIGCLSFLRFYYQENDGTKNKLGYFTALVCQVLALLSKTVTATMGPALLVVLWFKNGRLSKRDLKLVSPMIIIGMALWTRHRMVRNLSRWSIGQ